MSKWAIDGCIFCYLVGQVYGPEEDPAITACSGASMAIDAADVTGVAAMRKAMCDGHRKMHLGICEIAARLRAQRSATGGPSS